MMLSKMVPDLTTQVKAELAHLIVLADGLSLVLIVLRVVNLRVDPGSLVVWIVNLSRLPLSVHLIVPVLGLGCVRVGDVFRLLPVLGLDILGIVNLGSVNPVIGLAHLRVLDLLGREEVPVVSERSLLG